VNAQSALLHNANDIDIILDIIVVLLVDAACMISLALFARTFPKARPDNRMFGRTRFIRVLQISEKSELLGGEISAVAGSRGEDRYHPVDLIRNMS